MTTQAAKIQTIQDSSFNDPATKPIYALLIQIGKKLLRPGGMELTRKMLEMLKLNKNDEVVEFAPGTGATAKMALSYHPARYTAIEMDPNSVKLVSRYLNGSNQKCLLGRAENTGLPDASSSVVYGEAIMNMKSNETKQSIIAEPSRILKPGGAMVFMKFTLNPMI